MSDRYFNKLKELLPEPIRQFGGLVSLTFIVILSFAILNIFFGQGEELVEKMKKEIVELHTVKLIKTYKELEQLEVKLFYKTKLKQI